MLSLGSEWALPSGNAFCDPVFRKGLWNKMLVELIFRNLSIHPCFILVVIWAGMQFVAAPLIDSGFLPLPITGSFTCHLCIHFHNTIAPKSSLHNFCCTLKCKAFLVKPKFTVYLILLQGFCLLSFLLSAAVSLTSILSPCTAMSQVLSQCLHMVSHQNDALDSPSNHKASGEGEKKNCFLCTYTSRYLCFCACFWLNQCRRVASTSLYEDRIQQYYHS